MAGNCQKCGDCSKCRKTKVSHALDEKENELGTEETVLIRLHQVEITINQVCRTEKTSCRENAGY